MSNDKTTANITDPDDDDIFSYHDYLLAKANKLKQIATELEDDNVAFEIGTHNTINEVIPTYSRQTTSALAENGKEVYDK